MHKPSLWFAPVPLVQIPVAIRAVDAIGGALFRRAKIFPAMDALRLRV